MCKSFVADEHFMADEIQARTSALSDRYEATGEAVTQRQQLLAMSLQLQEFYRWELFILRVGNVAGVL